MFLHRKMFRLLLLSVFTGVIFLSACGESLPEKAVDDIDIIDDTSDETIKEFEQQNEKLQMLAGPSDSGEALKYSIEIEEIPEKEIRPSKTSKPTKIPKPTNTKKPTDLPIPTNTKTDPPPPPPPPGCNWEDDIISTWLLGEGPEWEYLVFDSKNYVEWGYAHKCAVGQAASGICYDKQLSGSYSCLNNRNLLIQLDKKYEEEISFSSDSLLNYMKLYNVDTRVTHNWWAYK